MSVKINGKIFSAEYLSEPKELEQGMMGRKELNGCMVFQVKRGHHSFWMKNTLIPLDIVFVLNKRISNLHINCPPAGNTLKLPTYSGMADNVIEFPANTANEWKIGDFVDLHTE